jgi:hypothetical protein
MKESIEQELRDLSPLLLELKEKEEGHKVPEGYFMSMQDDVLKQLKLEMQTSFVIEDKKATKSKLQVWREIIMEEITWLIQPRYAIAFASLLVVCAMSWYFTRAAVTDNTTASIPDSEEIELYLEEHLAEIETEQIWSVANDQIAEVEKQEDTKIQEHKKGDKPLLKEATDKELDEIMNEMIQNEELTKEDLENIL